MIACRHCFWNQGGLCKVNPPTVVPAPADIQILPTYKQVGDQTYMVLKGSNVNASQPFYTMFPTVVNNEFCGKFLDKMSSKAQEYETFNNDSVFRSNDIIGNMPNGRK